MEITIRRIGTNDADIALLASLARQTFYDTFKDTCTAEDMQSFLGEYYRESIFRRELSDTSFYFFFAEIDKKPVGYFLFKEDYEGLPLMKQWKALQLKRIYVDKEYHGKGIAQKMMDYIIEYARQLQYEAIWLGVWEHNLRAQKFYEKYEFVYSGYTHDFPIGNTPQTDCWFWKFL